MHRPTVAAFAAASLAAVVAIGVTAPAFAGNDSPRDSKESTSASHAQVESSDATEHATPEAEIEHSAAPAATAAASAAEGVHHHKGKKHKHSHSNQGRGHAEDAAHHQAVHRGHKSAEPGDDNGEHATEAGDDRSSEAAEPGEDDRDHAPEAGDDRSGHDAGDDNGQDAGDDNGNHGGHGSDG